MDQILVVEGFEKDKNKFNLTDERYVKEMPAHKKGSQLRFNLTGVNDEQKEAKGSVEIALMDSKGKKVFRNKIPVILPAGDRLEIPVSLKLPEMPDGYLLQTYFIKEGSSEIKSSRRYLKVGQLEKYSFYEGIYPNKTDSNIKD